VPKARQPSPLLRFVPSVVAGLCGIAFLGFLGVRCGEMWSARSWDSVEGRVIESRLSSGRPRSSIRYEYRVQGRTLTGNRVGLFQVEGPGFSHASVQRYPLGAPVRVFYDPAAPTRAVLEREPTLWVLPFAAIGLGLLVYAARIFPTRAA